MSSILRPILLVEDDPNDVELVTTALHNGNLANPVMVARDGVEALNLLRREGNTGHGAKVPVVVLTDIKMPRMNGLELLKEIRNDSRLKHIPAVIMTSSRASPDLDEAYKLGVNAYIVKPVRLATSFGPLRRFNLAHLGYCGFREAFVLPLRLR